MCNVFEQLFVSKLTWTLTTMTSAVAVVTVKV